MPFWSLRDKLRPSDAHKQYRNVEAMRERIPFQKHFVQTKQRLFCFAQFCEREPALGGLFHHRLLKPMHTVAAVSF